MWTTFAGGSAATSAFSFPVSRVRFAGGSVVLVSWDSPLVPPLAVGFVVIGYLTIIGSALGFRASIQKIVQRARDRQLERLQHRINAFRSRYTELSPKESE